MSEQMQERLAQRLVKKQLHHQSIKPQSILEVALQRIEDKKLEENPSSWGFDSLDRILKGVIQGRLLCLSGLSNAGKTQMASNFAINLASQGKKVLYFALEPDVNLVDYLASVQFKKPFEEVTNEDLLSINNNIEIYTKNQIPSIKKMIEVINSLPRYDLVIVDHIGYFIKGESNGGVLQEQEDITQKLAGLTKSKKTTIMFIMHMRKKSNSFKKKKDDSPRLPTMDELKGSSAFYQDATDVLFITRAVADNEIEQMNDGKIVVVKTKSGKNGIVPIYFHDDSAKISEAEDASYDIF